jgi:hypothetical protein
MSRLECDVGHGVNGSQVDAKMQNTKGRGSMMAGKPAGQIYILVDAPPFGRLGLLFQLTPAIGNATILCAITGDIWGFGVLQARTI